MLINYVRFLRKVTVSSYPVDMQSYKIIMVKKNFLTHFV